MCYQECNGISYFGFDNLSEVNDEGNFEISAKEYLLAIFTTEYSDSLYQPTSVTSPLYSIRDSDFVAGEGNEYIEKQLAQSYRSKENEKSSSAEGVNLVNIEYRTNGVKDIKITSVYKLWGENPGNVLNDYFFIKKYMPEAIVSSTSEKLLYGFTEEESMPRSINECLDLQPLAQPCIRLMFNNPPDERPCNVQFVVELETDEGITLTDTTRVIYINDKTFEE
jgi:hypothetical protein